MKKLPLIIMLSAAGITGVAMAQTSPSSTTTNGASSSTGYGTTMGTTTTTTRSTMNGAARTNGAAEPIRGTTSTSTGALGTPSTSGAEIGKDIEGYGKAAGAEGSQVSPARGSTRGTTDAPMRTNGAAGMTNGAAGGTMMQRGPGMTGTTGTSGVTWSCPSGYTLSTATRDGTPLCYPNTGPMPGR